METFDSKGSVLPVGAPDQGIVSKKIADKDGQGQGNRHQNQKKAEPVQLPEEEEDIQTEKHAIDIVV